MGEHDHQPPEQPPAPASHAHEPSRKMDGATVFLLVFFWLLATGFGVFLIWTADAVPSFALPLPATLFAAVVVGLLRITGKLTER